MFAGQPARPDLFDPGTMTSVALPGLRVRLGHPVQVTEQISWITSWPGEDKKTKSEYFHFFPVLGKFPGGNLIAAYSLVPDALDCPLLLSGYQISTDGGADWGRRYPVLAQQPAIFVPRAPDSVLALPFNLTAGSPGDERDFVGPSYLFEEGGRQMLMRPEGMRVSAWPWQVGARYSSQPRENWTIGLSIGGNFLRIGGRLLATGYCVQGGGGPYRAVLLTSEDGGHGWRYYSTIAEPAPSLIGKKGYEGPNECAVVELADAGLMAVFRVGSGKEWKLRRCYSHDRGGTWTQPDIIPAYSVYPQLVRIANGAIALSTGRPGIDLWLSSDRQAAAWQKIDIVAHHNEWAPDPTYRIASFTSGTLTKSQTTSYTGMVEIAPNRLLLIYDRDPVIRPPEQAPAGPGDLTRVFILPIEVERTRPAG